MRLKDFAHESVRRLRFSIEDRLDSRWNNDPLVGAPSASAEEFHALRREAEAHDYPDVDAVEREVGFAIDPAWLSELGFHTQVVKKRSALTYPAHGRLLYAILRRHIADSAERFFTVVETGTARGYSALCIAKALVDSGKDGRIVTIDVLPHLVPIYWNCIDDLDGRKTRAELLAPWSDLLDRIVFLQGDTLRQLPRVGVGRVNFAFLDAQHTRHAVMQEFAFVAPLQRAGDMVFFDDVTPGQFPGVVDAVAEIEARGEYRLRRLTAARSRSYAWGPRV